jgi:hypothetical protein
LYRKVISATEGLENTKESLTKSRDFRMALARALDKDYLEQMIKMLKIKSNKSQMKTT